MPDRSKLPLLYAATFANFCAFGMYFTAIQLFVQEELGGSKAQVGLAIGVFSLSAVLLRPTIGRGVDQRGRRPYLLGALLIVTVSSLGFLLADDIVTVVLLRLLQGVAGATYYTTAASMVTDLTPLRRRASGIATFSLFLYGGFAAGPALAGVLIDAGGFAWAWWTSAALGAAGLACARLLPETLPARSAAAATDADREPQAGARPRGRRRVLHPAAVGPGVVLMTTGMGYASVTGFSELYARHIGMGSAGALYATFAVTVIGVRLVSGRLADTYGRIAVALPGLLVAAAGLALLATVQAPAAAFPGVASFGAGFALIFPALMAFTVDQVSEHERGEALGSFTAFMDVGMGGGGYLVGTVADRAGFGAAYGTPAVLCLVGAGVLATIARRAGVPLRRAAAPDPAGIELS